MSTRWEEEHEEKQRVNTANKILILVYLEIVQIREL